MDYPPYGRRRQEEEEEEEYPPRGPPSHYGVYPPPPQVTHVSHTSHMGGGPPYDNPPPPSNYPYAPSHNSRMGGGGGEYDYPPQETNYPPHATSVSVHHVSHQGPHYEAPNYESPNYEAPHYEADNTHHHSRPHMPSFPHRHEHQTHHEPAYVASKPTVRVYSKAEPNYSLAVRDGNVILAPSNPSDPYQHWIKDEKYSTKVKDEQGYPSFVLVNKATGEAIKHSVGATHPVQLTPYIPDKFDESILWTESKDLGDSYRTIRMVNNIRLNVDAFNGDQNHGGVRDGTKIVLWEWKKGDNQRWKIVRY